tara:strand:+ start:46 stop:861 length:816 start_codon:yes stop_codon:yes gene_type:complete
MKKILILFIAFTCFGLSAQSSAEAYDQISTLVNDGIKKFNAKDNYGAIADYSKAIELIQYLNDPDYLASIVYTNRALAKKGIRDFKSAIADLDKALEAFGSDKNTESYITRGKMKLGLEDYYSAISDFSKVIKIEPNHIFAHIYRGNAKYILKDYYSAISDFTTVIKLNMPVKRYTVDGKPYDVSEAKEQDFLNKFDNAVFVGYLDDESGEVIEEGLTNFPTSAVANAYSYRGMSKEGLGDNNGACKDYKKGAELGGDFNKKLLSFSTQCN